MISDCGSQTINPLLEKSSLELVVSTTSEELNVAVACPLASVVGFSKVSSNSYLNCRLVFGWTPEGPL